MRYVGVLAAWLILLAATPVRGDEPPPAVEEQANRLYEEGRKQFNLGRYEQAADLWIRAYELNGDPNFLYNVGQAYRQLDRYEEAIRFYRS